MKKVALLLNYATFVLLLMSLFFSSYYDAGKFVLLIILAFMLHRITTRSQHTCVHHHYNVLFIIAVAVFVLYGLFLKGPLYESVRMEFLLAALVGSLSLLYVEKRLAKPKKPRPLPAKKPVPVAKPVARKTARKVTKRPARKVAKKVATKKAPAKKKVAKKSTRKVAKKASSSDGKMISFSQDHEVAYVLRKHNRRITKDNKAKVIEAGKKFHKDAKFKPHNRQSFYKYMKQIRLLSKLK